MLACAAGGSRYGLVFECRATEESREGSGQLLNGRLQDDSHESTEPEGVAIYS